MKMKVSPFFAGCRWAARLADDKQGENIVVLDVRRLTALSDFFVFVGALSTAHLNALEDYLSEELKKNGFRMVRREGHRSDVWRVLDFGGFMIHLLQNEARMFYGLEHLWQDGRHVRWENHASRKD